MAAIIDTCSLLACARYYAPFDTECKFSEYVKEQVQDRAIILLDRVASECNYQSQGSAVKAYPFLKEVKNKTTTDGLELPARFYRMIDDNFQNKEARKLLSEAEYQLQRDSYMKSADFSIIAYAYLHKNEDVIVITEESEFSNDGKPFKKIPAICKIINVRSMNVAKYLTLDDRFHMSVDYDSSKLF